MKRNKNHLRKRFSYSEIRRIFSLPSSIDTDKIVATHIKRCSDGRDPEKDEEKINPKKQIAIALGLS